MNFPKSVRALALGAAAALLSTPAFAQIDARMFRQPSVSKIRSHSSMRATSGSCPEKGGTASG